VAVSGSPGLKSAEALDDVDSQFWVLASMTLEFWSRGTQQRHGNARPQDGGVEFDLGPLTRSSDLDGKIWSGIAIESRMPD
jgi:hypothetical protein